MNQVLEIFKWPIAVVLIFIVFLLIQYRKIGALIDRIRGISKQGIDAGGSFQQQDVGEEKRSAEVFLANLETGELRRSLDIKYIKQIEDFLTRVLDKEKLKDSVQAIPILTRQFAIAWGAYWYQLIYSQIFGSQLALLNHLNSFSRGETGETLRVLFYEPVVARWPEAFKDYPFSFYIAFLVSYELIFLDGERYKITEFGRGFLSFIVNRGLSFNRTY